MGGVHKLAILDLGQGLFVSSEFPGFFKCIFNDIKKNISSLWKMESFQVSNFPFGVESAKEITTLTRGPRISPQLKRTCQKGDMVFLSFQ